MLRRNYALECAQEFAERISELGFMVYLSKNKEYGFVTDKTQSRVLCFSFSGLTSSLSGNYGPPSVPSGTGWRLEQCPEELRTKQDVKAALYAHPCHACGSGWKYFTTVKQHLATYGESSGYQVFVAEAARAAEAAGGR